jgi:hypothetical protein
VKAQHNCTDDGIPIIGIPSGFPGWEKKSLPLEAITTYPLVLAMKMIDNTQNASI